MDSSPASLTLTEARRLLRSGQLGPGELIRAVIDAAGDRDGQIGAYLSLDAEKALAAADTADISLPLGGLPIAIKDNINVKGDPCGCASRMLTGSYTAPYDAGVITRLRAAGAIPVGRTNMDEFAMGSSTENSAIGKTVNPWDHTRIPGGSSGGSAAAVTSGLAVAALGSDTGGSIRQPASLCGCVGLKPTYGRVSRSGLVAFASSLDQIGPITKTAEDAALLLNALCGHDAHDSTSLDEPVPDFTASLDDGVRGLKIGLPKEYFIDGIDPGVRDAVETAVRQLESLGAEPVEISLPHTEFAIATYYIVATAEASANLARFDGVRYGHRADAPTGLLDHYARTRAQGFGDEVKRRILLGTYVLSSGYHDAYYLHAQKVRTLIRRDFENAFASVDLIASPTSPVTALKIGDRINDPLKMYLDDIFTTAANLAGIPGISIPCGFSPLPVGLQLLGKPLAEHTLLKTAHAYQLATDWHTRTPAISK